MKIFPALAFVCFAVAASGCANSSFGGGSGAGKSDTATSKKSEDGNPTSDTGTDTDIGKETPPSNPPENATPEQEAIGRCLKAWGKSPFGAGAYDQYREIYAAVTVLGIGGHAVEDTQTTTEPELVLVHAAVNVMGSANYVLMNPNGWYCMMVNVNVKAQTTIQAQCQAKLADSRVQVDVASKASPTGVVGVNVLSDVKVERKPSVDSPSGC